MDNNLRCTVNSCAHNMDTRCCLETIQVIKTAPDNFVNTFCESYEEKGKTASMQNQTAHNQLDINCNAKNCKYNIENVCSKINVTISLNKNNAECIDFSAIEI